MLLHVLCGACILLRQIGCVQKYADLNVDPLKKDLGENELPVCCISVTSTKICAGSFPWVLFFLKVRFSCYVVTNPAPV